MINQWKKELTKIRWGKIWWYNFEYDFSIHNLPQDLEKRFYRAIEQHLLVGKNTKPLEILLEVLESPTQTFSLKGRQVRKTARLTCVIPSYAFASALIDRDLIGAGQSEVFERKIWEMFEHGEITPDYYNDKAELKSSRRNFFWATLTNSLDQFFSASERELSAADVRNLLGLSYLWEGVGLYRIDLPDQLPAGITICIPTTLDSSPTCVFLPTDNHSHFGQTFHLHTMGVGVEEVIISPLLFTKDCKVTQIGQISGPLPDDDTVWCELERRVISRRGRKTTIKKANKKVDKKVSTIKGRRRHE